MTVLGEGAYINTGLIVPHRRGPGRPLLKGEEDDNAAHRSVRARVEHVIGRMKNHKILRDCRQRGNGLHHAIQAVAHMHNLALAASADHAKTAGQTASTRPSATRFR